MFDRKAGTVEGFKASEAMKATGISWDDTTLAEYLRDPKRRVPGTTMIHAGIKQPAQLNQLIDYLRKTVR
jgi:cytochrome c